MPTCSAVNCTYKHVNKKSGKSIHRFPFSRAESLQKWVNNVRREDWYPSKTSVLCSDHFEESCFLQSGPNRLLRPDAVPTIFNFPSHLLKVPKERKATTKNIADSTELPVAGTSTCSSSEEIVHFVSEHNYCEKPEVLKRKLEEKEEQNVVYKKKLKTKQQRIRRLNKKVHSMSELVDHLTKKKLVSENAALVLKKSFSGAPLELLTRMLKNTDEKISREKYPPQLRSFAITLQFYSSRAYDYVRSIFNFALPHPSVLRKWYSTVDGEPGFSTESFRILKSYCDSNKVNGKKTLCSLMLDEMSIRHHIQYDGKQMRGYVDIGSEIDDDDAPVASNALVFMVVSLDSHWKLPVAYFFINGLSGEERGNLVSECLSRLHDVGVVVPSVTFDGPSCHFTMAKYLGARLELPDPQPWFEHPSDKNIRVFIVLDACHMLKLMRNNWATIKIFKDKDGKKIDWTYIVSLDELQEEEGLRVGNKLRTSHIKWHQQKMKVNLAAQTLSSSVANAIEFCNKDLHLPRFKDSEETVSFIKIIDRLFDILNSRNPLGKGFKSPLRPKNEHFWRPFLEDALGYIIQLTDPGGILMYLTPKKTPFVGFYISALSMIMIFDDMVKKTSLMKYMLTYKFSQDHLELFFSAIRCRGGWNNNPTAIQFISAYKRLLLKHEIKCSNGNVAALENVPILQATQNVKAPSEDYSLDIVLAKKYDLCQRDPVETEHDYNDIPNVNPLSEFSKNVISYIAGYVVRMVEKKINCEECICELQQSIIGSHEPLRLLLRKTRGGLIIPSDGVITVCNETEKCFRRMLNANSGRPPQQKNVAEAISTVVLEETYFKGSAFPRLEQHMFHSTPLDNHLFKLIKLISASYVKIRMHHLTRCENEKMNKDKIRKKLTKLVLFKHQ